jgi:hypothetical protein
LRDGFALRLVLGWSLGEIQTAIIGPAALSTDERDALWLYAWPYPRGGERAAEYVRATMRSAPGMGPA